MDESKARDFAAIKRVLSPARFESHRHGANDSDDLIFSRYQWNANVCERFYIPLKILEVVLRNRLNDLIAEKFKSPAWLTSVPQWLQPNGREDVEKAMQFLAERNRPITQPRMVQEMSFGFWTSLFNSRYETLFHGIGSSIFPGMPRSIRTRANVSSRLENIRYLRNRIFHFRRIWNRPDLTSEYYGILEVVEWVDADARRLLLPANALEDFLAVIAQRPV